MGEGEIKTEGVCDVEDTIYVAVGKDVEASKSVLWWALKSFSGKNICLLHVHQPIQLVSLMKEMHSASKLRSQVIKTCQELENQKMHNLLNQYVRLAQQVGVQPGKIWIEMRKVEKGIVHIISEHGVKWLVMGAAAEKYYSKNLSELKSSKAIFVCHQAPVSCQIWFSCKGCLIWTRCEVIGSHLSRLIKLPSQTKTSTLFPQYPKEDAAKDAKTLQSLDVDENLVHNLNLPPSTMNLVKGDGSPSDSPFESPDSPFSSSSYVLQDQFNEKVTIDDKIDYALRDAQNSEPGAHEETVVAYRAEEDPCESAHRDEASERSYTEDFSQSQREEMENLLVQQRQELEKMKDKHDQIMKELQLAQNQKLSLERQLVENCDKEKVLEEKIIQAVNLMISFKEKRDLLRIQCDNALEEAQKYKKLIEGNAAAICVPHFFEFHFLDIMKATQNLDPSMKIGEGKSGSVYKGVIRQTKVAIKILPPCSPQSDSNFEYKAEVLSRVRHPNIVTLVGACTESRSLIYEYLENGSLEDHLAGCFNSHPLPWQFRLRIVGEICSVLVFLHAKRCCIVHGNLKLTNILLDANCVCKISDLGTNNFGDGQNFSKNDLEASFYEDPEVTNGRYTRESDVYSFGIVILRLLTARPASSVLRDVQCAMEVGRIHTILDYSAGDWPLQLVKQLVALALWCCQNNRVNRPDLVEEVCPVIEPWRNLSSLSYLGSTSSRAESKVQRRIPSHFVCPILQDVMKDPYIAADGFTYEADAIKGWLNSGHETSPMTNLKLDHCDLIPNYALYYAIQEWQQRP